MDTRPWDYWEPDERTPKARIGAAVRLVETVLARRPDHPQAQHLYIHLMENERRSARGPRPPPTGSPRPLDHRAPAISSTCPAISTTGSAGWQDSIRANIDAARADEAYIWRGRATRASYRYGYYPHNVHFIVTSAQMARRPADRDRARRSGWPRILDPEAAAQLAWVQAINAAPYFATPSSPRPAQMLALAEPDPRLPYVVAHAPLCAGGRLCAADATGAASIASCAALAGDPRRRRRCKPMIDQGVPAPDLLRLAETRRPRPLGLAAGRLSTRRRAITGRRSAIEDRISYMEPPWWYYPVRQSLGAALYRAGRHEEAQAGLHGRARPIARTMAGRSTASPRPSARWAGRAEAAAAEAALRPRLARRCALAEDGPALYEQTGGRPDQREKRSGASAPRASAVSGRRPGHAPDAARSRCRVDFPPPGRSMASCRSVITDAVLPIGIFFALPCRAVRT